MNVTDKVSKEIGGRVQQVITMHKEVQIYHWEDGYAWRDNRVLETRDIHNQRGLSFDELKEKLELNILKV